MKNNILCLLIIFIFTIHSAFATEEITIAGTGDSQKLMSALAKAFEQVHLNTKINVPNSIGSSGGIKNTALGTVQLGRVARKIKDSEKKYNLKYILFAYSPMVFAVNSSVKGLDNISSQQVIDIYAGSLKTWEELGAQKGKIFVASRELGDSSYSVILKNIEGFKHIKKIAGEIIYSTPEMTYTINTYDNTIGYMPLSQSIGDSIHVLNYNGIAPIGKNIMNGSYPLVVPLGIVYKELTPLSKKFIDFIFSTSGKKIIEEFGLVFNSNKVDYEIK